MNATINAIEIITKARHIMDEDKSGQRSAWGRGVLDYANELLDTLEEAIDGSYFDPDDLAACKMVSSALLNGASDWNAYSWGGSALIYNGDIAARLCSPSELKKTRNGERRPNSREDWLDVQARALFQASRRATRAIMKAACVNGW